MFSLPDDFMSPINMIYNHSFKLEQQPYDDIFEDRNDRKGRIPNTYDNASYLDFQYGEKPFYTIIDDTYVVLFFLNR